MPRLHRFVSLICFCLLAGSAWATKITIQDPSNTPFTVTPVTTSTFVVTFTDDCTSALNPSSAGYSDAGCFAFTNRTGSDWTSITLSTVDTPTNGGFTCASPIFSSQNCSYDASTGQYVLAFDDGTIASQTNNLNYFVISESDLDPSSLTFDATVTYAASTPEPSAWLLMGTGLLCAWAVRARQRRLA